MCIAKCFVSIIQKQKQTENKTKSLHDHSGDTKSLSDSLDNIPSSVFGPEGIVTRFTLPLSHGRKKPRHG